MNLHQRLLFVGVLLMIFVVFWSHAAHRKSFHNKIGAGKPETTLAPQIPKVMTQLKQSNITLKEADYKKVINQLKNIFHTKKPIVCAKCKQSN